MQSLHCEDCARKKCKVIQNIQYARQSSNETGYDNEQCEFDGLVET